MTRRGERQTSIDMKRKRIVAIDDRDIDWCEGGH
jgi:hypothetical protein